MLLSGEMFSRLLHQCVVIHRRKALSLLLFFSLCMLIFESRFKLNQMAPRRTFNVLIKKNRNSSPPIYIVGAYLIREDFLRVILITDCRTETKMYAEFSDNRNPVTIAAKNLSIINEKCPFWPPCTYGGLYAEFKFPSKFIGDQVILSAVESNGQSSSASISVLRSVSPHQRAHSLAVCVPAMFYITDTVQIIQFIEIWLLAGATKFFFYWQAISPAVKDIFSFYQASGIDIDLVAWPHLYNATADLSVYYSGQIISINDCLHKARSQAEFAATVDLDELIVLGNSTNLIEILKTTKPNAAGRGLSRAHAHFDEPPAYSNDPKELSFSSLGIIDHDRPRSALDKLILRPENVRRSFVHWITELEPMAEALEDLPPSQANLIHIRSIVENVDHKNYEKTGIFVQSARKITENWKRRLEIFSDYQLRNLIITPAISDIAREMEMCLLKLKGQMDSTCFTASHCVSTLKNNTNTAVDWRFPEKEWIEM